MQMQLAATGGNNSIPMGPVKGLVKMDQVKDIPHVKEGGQPVFEAFRKENPGPLSPVAERLMVARGLQDPLAATKQTGIDAYA